MTSQPPSSPADDSRLARIFDERGPLTNRAYRMLGSLSDAQDAVQEAYTRWFALDDAEQAAIASPCAWLNTVVSRICLDLLGSARVRREQYVGNWLPDPVPDPAEWDRVGRSPADDPAERITLDESVTMAFLVVLEAMTPPERVSFLLHDVYGYSFTQIAEIVGRSPGACRQLAWSARRRVEDARADDVPTDRGRDIVRAFKTAWQASDIAALITLLDPSVTIVADGGGRVPARLEPVVGADPVAAEMLAIRSRFGSVELVECTVNGEPGLAATADGAVITVFAFDLAAGRVRRIWAVRNPDKLVLWPTPPG